MGAKWLLCAHDAVGYGGMLPATLLGRFLALLWFTVGLVLLSYLNGELVVAFIEPPPRYLDFQTWTDVRAYSTDTGRKFCAANVTFLNTTFWNEGLTPSRKHPAALDAMIFRDTVEQCYEELLDRKV